MRTLPKIETLVIKIGSNILTGDLGGINQGRIESIVRSVVDIHRDIHNIVIVSSGAVAAGYKILNFPQKPDDIIDKQACAAAGQARLIWFYEQALMKFGKTAAQILISKDDFTNRRRFLNARHSIKRLLELGVIPIINENDSVVLDELKNEASFGDNDNLSALVASLIDADMLLILSDVDGLYDRDPKRYPDATLMTEIKYIDEDIQSIAGHSMSRVGTGGMKSKITAAKKALMSGCYVGIINGMSDGNIGKFIGGSEVGTFFSHVEDPMNKRKFWIGFAAAAKGDIVVDAGAVSALKSNGRSLLPSGVLSAKGRFAMGDIVRVLSPEGVEIARGKARYNSTDLSKIAGKKTDEITGVLGYKISDTVIHRDDIVITG